MNLLLLINYLSTAEPQTLYVSPVLFHSEPPHIRTAEAVGTMEIPLAPVYLARLYSPLLGFLEIPAQDMQGIAEDVTFPAFGVAPAFKVSQRIWAATIPNAAPYLSAIAQYLADPASLFLGMQRTNYTDGSVAYDTLFNVPLTGWERNRGKSKYAITLRGRKWVPHVPPSVRQLTAVLQENTSTATNTTYSVRIPLPNDLGSIVPGDRVQYGGYVNFRVAKLSYALSVAQRYVDLSG